LVAAGIASMILIHVLINVGMTMSLMPVTGIPLPFLSYGGSSLMANLIAIGFVLNINMRRQKILF
jgi:rod shape determining protein RodA